MKKQNFFKKFILLGIVGTGAYIWFHQRHFTPASVDQPGSEAPDQQEARFEEEDPLPEPDNSGQMAGALETSQAAPIRSPLDGRTRKNESLTLQPPTVEHDPIEGEENLHDTSPSIITFAEQVAEKMEEALQSQAKAESLFRDLSDCAQSSQDQSIASFQAVCAVNAARLAGAYPDSLKGKFETLRSQLKDEVSKLVQAQGY